MIGRWAWHAVALLALVSPWAGGVESDPLLPPASGPRADAVRHYNEGVPLLAARKFREAQSRFEAALAADETLPEAHNNLAYALRMQGAHNFAPSLTHYNRALALNPNLAQAYVYRGVLFMLQGDMARARQDLRRLQGIHPVLARELERALDSGSATERSGISAQYE